MSIPKPPYDIAVIGALDHAPIPKEITLEMLPSIRKSTDDAMTAASIVALFPGINHSEVTVAGPHGDIILSIFRPAEMTGPLPAIYYIHGGGMILGNRFTGVTMAVEWALRFGAVVISVEYRYAPEHKHPVPVNDCYAGLKWVGDNFTALDIDPDRFMISGQSAGGGLAAGVTLLVRDRGGPELCGQVLAYPMLDDRNTGSSKEQFANEGTWSAASNELGWSSLLGSDRANVDIYAAPGRATDLSHLPPAFIDVASTELFRDEDIAYASELWAAGVQAELHIWPGGFHASEIIAPEAAISKNAISARTAWVGRMLGSQSAFLTLHV